MTPNQIKKRRGSLGLNQNEFAVLIGVQRATVSSWENGHKFPREKSICKMLALPTYQWVGLTDEERDSAIDSVPANNIRGEYYNEEITKIAKAIEAKLRLKNK